MDQCLKKTSFTKRLQLFFYAVAIVTLSSASLLASDLLVANAPQLAENVVLPASSKPLPLLSDQAPLEVEKKSVKNSPPLNPDSNVTAKWDKQTLSREKQVAITENIRSAEEPSVYSKSLSIWRSMFSLLIVLALIVGGSFILRRFMPASSRFSKTTGLEILSRTAVGAKQSVCLVKMGPRLVLIGLSPNHMAALDVVNDQKEIAMILGQVETASPESITNSFGQVFRQESGQFDESPDNPPLVQEKDDLNEVRQVHLARRELSGLLDKVKGLTRHRGRY